MSFLFLGLFLSILLGYWLSLNNSPLDKWLMSLLVTLPVFFSGIIFSKALQASAKANQLLASNILGAMVGGMLEYNSMYFGIRSLYWLALVLYTLALLSWLTWDRRS